MAVETQPRPTPAPLYAQPLLRNVLWGAAAMLGISGALAAIVSGASAFMVYQYARARGIWGTDEPPAGAAEEISFSAIDDQVTISGWFFPTRGAAPAPAIVLCHGIWTGRRECLPLALKFHQAGYNVLCFDFRAHGLSGGRYTTVGHNETNDVLGAIDYLLQRPEVDHERIGVVGFSMGGAAAIQAAARCPNIAAVVADSSYSAFLDAARYSFHVITRLPHAPLAPIAQQWAKWIVNVDPNLLRPIDVIGRIAPRPILIMHGEQDEIVPVGHAYALFKAADEPKELWIVPDMHHVGARDLLPDEYFDRVETFLSAALSGPNVALHPVGALA